MSLIRVNGEAELAEASVCICGRLFFSVRLSFPHGQVQHEHRDGKGLGHSVEGLREVRVRVRVRARVGVRVRFRAAFGLGGVCGLG